MTTSVEYVRADLRGGDVAMAEQFLDGPDVVLVLEAMRRERVTEGVYVWRASA